MSQTRSWMAVPALAVGVLLLAGAPAFAADTATIYDVSQEGLTVRGRPEARRLLRHPELASPTTARSPTRARRSAPSRTSRSRAARTSPAARRSPARSTSPRCSRSARSPRRPRCAARPSCPALAGLGGDFRAAPSVSHSELTTADNDGKTHGQVRARHVGLLRPDARRPARHGPGREAARHVRRRRQRHPALELDPQAHAGQAGDHHLLRRGARRAAPRCTPPTSARPRRRSATSCPSSAPSSRSSPPTRATRSAARASSRTSCSRPSRAPRRARPSRRRCTPAASTREADVSGGTAPYSYKWASSTTVLEHNTERQALLHSAPRVTAS